MTNATPSTHSHGASAGHVLRMIAWLDRMPYAALALPLRFAVATIFWNSGMTKVANWATALELFREEYRLPLVPPELAAYMAVSIELTAPVLLVLGLGTRFVALILFGMTMVIQIFVYPLAWPTHLQWVAMLLVLVCRGAGHWSLDDWLYRRSTAPPR